VIGSTVWRFPRRFLDKTTAAESGGPSLPALQIGDLLARCYPGTTDHPVWHRTNVHRALPKFAVSLGRTNAWDGRSCVRRTLSCAD
jgi:hypothetical protein